MNSVKNFALLVLAVAVGVLGTLYWRQSARLAELEGAAARLTDEARVARQRATDTEQRLASAEKRRAELESERNEPRSRASEPRMARTATRAAANPLDNPAVQKMMATGMRGALDQRFGGLFRQLKLSPAELEKLKDLLTERQMSALDVMTAGRAQGLSATEVPALMEKVQAEVDQNIRQLLGDQRFERYQNFNQNIGSYTVLDQIERRLSYTNAPLDPAQSEALLRVLVETAPPPPAEPAGLRGVMGFAQTLGATHTMVAGLSPPAITDQTIARASSVLSPAQTEVLRQLQAEQQSQTNAMQSLRVNAIGGGTAPTEAVHVIEVATPVDRSVPSSPPKR